MKGISGIAKPFTIYAWKGGTNYNFTVTIKDASGNQASNSPIKFSAKTFDVQTATEPIAPPTDVISIFSDKYVNIANCNYNPNWNQTTIFALNNIDGNEYISLSNFNYQGTEFGKHVNASAMKYLHLDVWTPNETSLQVAIISPGKEKLVTLSPLALNKWNNFNIPLSSFNGVALNDLFQFKFVGSGGKIVYLDNLYFSKSAVTSAPELNQSEFSDLFPNPIQDQFTINSDYEIKSIVISNINGQFVKTITINSKYAVIDMSSLKSGNYIITIENMDGLRQNKKLVKL